MEQEQGYWKRNETFVQENDEGSLKSTSGFTHRKYLLFITVHNKSFGRAPLHHRKL